MKLRSVQEIYTDFAPEYEQVMRNELRYTACADMPQRVIDSIGPRPDVKILDIGCGTGLSSLPFMAQGWDVTGLDGSRSMVRKARRLPYTNLIRQDIESPWQVDDSSFDAAVLIGVLEYIEDPAALFRQAHKKLVDRGVFGVTVPIRNKSCTEVGLKSYYRPQITPAIIDAGFHIESWDRTLGFEDGGMKVFYWNYLLRRE
jgi:predicted TPR repeat methyltransferase